MTTNRNRLALMFAITGATAISVAFSLIIFPPNAFGARLEFLIYQREGLAPGAILRFIAGIGCSALIAAALLHGRRPSWPFAEPSRGAYRAWLFAAPAVTGAWILAAQVWAICASADASGYIVFHAYRTIGYPLLLAGVIAVTGGFVALFPFQLVAMLAAMAALAHALGGLAGDRRVALVALVFMSGNVSLLGYAAMIAPEAPFAALISAHLACVLFALRAADLRYCAAAGVALGLAILMRPAGYAFLAAVPALLFLLPAPRGKGIAVFVVGLTLPIGAASALNAMRGGEFATQSFGGIAILGVAAPLIAADMPSATPELAAAIAARTGSDAAALRATPIPHAQWRATMNAYNDMLWVRAFPPVEAWVNARHGDWPEHRRRAEAVRVAGSLAIEAIRYDPVGFVRHVVSQAYGMWLLSFLPHGPIAARLATCGEPTTRAAIVPQLDERAYARAAENRDALTPVDLFWAAATLLQYPAATIAALAALLSPILVFLSGRRDPVVAALAYSGLGAAAYVGLFAVAQVALPRYAVVMEPWLVCLTALAILAAARAISERPECAA